MLLPLLCLTAIQHTPWDALFKAAGTTADAVQVPPTKWRGGGMYALPIFNACWDDWRKLEPTTLDMAKRLRGSDTNEALKVAADALGILTPKKFTGNSRMLREAILACGGTPSQDISKLDAALATVPADVARAAATVIGGVIEADRLEKAAMAKISDVGTAAQLGRESLNFAHTYDLGPHSLALMDRFDLAPFVQAGSVVAQAVASSGVSRIKSRVFHFSWQTSIGRIELAGGKDNRHDLAGAAVVLETGDGSEFTGHGAVSGTQVLISTGKRAVFRDCGLAVFGVSEIYGFGGLNAYLASEGGVGAAVYGVSTVVDGGQSMFDCREFSEGAAVNGVGLLLNTGGRNLYKCRSLAQGFGGPKGFGALVDAHGKSAFEADDTKIDNASPQTAQHNTSMVQGAGFGRRADPGDHHSMAGGVGILVNGGSNNFYSCGVFGQGVAYWYSLGALVNFGGDNTYKGVWYVQGSAAHYSVGCFLAFGGGDHVETTMAQSLGQGHDYSIGLCHSFKGGNVFKSDGSGAFGSGRWNGIGLFAAEGKNSFEAGGESFGFAADHRPEESCFGFFAAPGVSILKSSATDVKAGKRWFLQNQPKPLVVGAGIAG